MGIGGYLYKALLKLPPELAHKIGKWGMKKRLFISGPSLSTEPTFLFGKAVNNPLGLAAGFDKNGELVDLVQNYGFGWDEVGSITYRGGRGNNGKRLARIRDNGEVGLWNRMGLNGDPAEKVVERLRGAKNPFGVNIAKTHDPTIVGDRAIEDMVKTYGLVRQLNAQDCLLYVAWNVSCPNTNEGKTFEEPGPLRELLSAAYSLGKKMPWVVKFSPNLSMEKLEQLVAVAEEYCDGYIQGNTNRIEYNGVYGGASGCLVRLKVLEGVKNLRALTDKVIIGCGGIYTGQDMHDFKQAGTTYFQALTGFVVGPNAGPHFAKNTTKEYEQLQRSTHGN